MKTCSNCDNRFYCGELCECKNNLSSSSDDSEYEKHMENISELRRKVLFDDSEGGSMIFSKLFKIVKEYTIYYSTSLYNWFFNKKNE